MSAVSKKPEATASTSRSPTFRIGLRPNYAVFMDTVEHGPFEVIATPLLPPQSPKKTNNSSSKQKKEKKKEDEDNDDDEEQSGPLLKGDTGVRKAVSFLSTKTKAGSYMATTWCMYPGLEYSFEVRNPSPSSSTTEAEADEGEGSSSTKVVATFKKTIPTGGPIDLPQFIWLEHLAMEDFNPNCIIAQPSDYCYSLYHPVPSEAQAIIHRFFTDALFVLPMQNSPGVVAVPNGQKRFCIDLRPKVKTSATPAVKNSASAQKSNKGTLETEPPKKENHYTVEAKCRKEKTPGFRPTEKKQKPSKTKDTLEEEGSAASCSSVRWDSNKKMRKVLPNLRLTINKQFQRTLELTAAFHEKKEEGTWMSPDFLKLLCSLHDNEKGKKASVPELEFMVFELWDLTPPPPSPTTAEEEKSSKNSNTSSTTTTTTITSPKLVAATCGFGIGSVFHDYTMATFLKDNRGLGTILSKTVGHLLTNCGYKLWYWGNRIGYMKQFEEAGYGGVDMERKEFYALWNEGRGVRAIKDLRTAVGNNEALVKSLE